jgi:hypothetical protein
MDCQRWLGICLWIGASLANIVRGDDAAAPRAGGAETVSRSIDSILEGPLREHGVAETAACDRTFLRRASLDLIGLLPAPEEIEAFVADPDPRKRELLVDRLLADREAYATHWLTFWSDALRNAYRGTGFIDNGRSQITGWLFAALYENTPYDRFVHELISPVPGSEGFSRGIKWRGVVNESQRPEVQAAQNVAQVFLGTNLKCASCHDSFVNTWKLADAYRLASVFAEQPLEIHHCDQPTGEISEVGFIYPELGSIGAAAPRDERMRRLADLVVLRENRRFARTIVNRLWGQLMGRGIVEPRDNLDSEALSPELLDRLADDFVEHGYNLKHTLRQIATSRAYQLEAVGLAADESEGFVFRGPLVKRLTAEQYVDAVSAVTGVWPEPPESGFKLDGRGQMGQLAAVAPVLAADRPELMRVPPITGDKARELLGQARWIWIDEGHRETAVGREAYFRAKLPRGDSPGRWFALVAGDDDWELFVDGVSAGSGRGTVRPAMIDLEPHLRRKEAVVAVRVKNGGKEPNAAGLIAVVFDLGAAGEVSVVSTTGEGWKGTDTVPRAWARPNFDDTEWSAVTVIGDAASEPWKLAEVLKPDSFEWSLDPRLVWRDRPVRAAMLVGDTLQSALGRPNREQTVTSRESLGTLLQALELTNGMTLDGLLQKGAKRMMASDGTPEEVVGRLFQTALGRAPSDAEAALARELMGEGPSVEGYADVLWTIVMLPEFQLVY